jgi:hypothetical protein
MSGERDISVLLGRLAPVLAADVYTFATVSDSELVMINEPLGIFRESEGVSLICLLQQAQGLGIKHEGDFKMISLTIHSSLQAVGLTARVSAALADCGISCNVVAGFYHDHLFVPANRANDAMTVLSHLK